MLAEGTASTRLGLAIRKRKRPFERGVAGKSNCLREILKSGQGRDRTGDTRIFSPLLYQLSYLS